MCFLYSIIIFYLSLGLVDFEAKKGLKTMGHFSPESDWNWTSQGRNVAHAIPVKLHQAAAAWMLPYEL